MIITKFVLYYLAPALFIATLLEAFYQSRQGSYNWKAFGITFVDFILRVMLNSWITWSIASPLLFMIWKHRITNWQASPLMKELILFLLIDFLYYWYHRAAHRIRWFWANHSGHHSPNELNLSAFYRLGIFGRLTGVLLFFSPLVYLGFSPHKIWMALIAILTFQHWVHVTWIPKLGWLEYIINTPSAHRVHHARNPEYLNANYGGVLIIYDRLFGTYVEERDDIPCDYGLVDRQTSNNPLRVIFDPWVSLFYDLRKARSFRTFFGYLLMPPGWNPHKYSKRDSGNDS